MSNCIVCNAPLKYVPAGVSMKSGQPKPYNAFYSCPNRHKQNVETPQPQYNPQPVQQPWQPVPQPPTKTDINISREPIKEDTQKVEGMVRHGLVCALIQKRGLEPIAEGDIVHLEGWVDYIINGPKRLKSEDLSEQELEDIGF